MVGEPFFRKTNLFEAGQDGFWLYRNPALAANEDGVVLLFCEARERPRGDEHSDWAPSAIAMRRSPDNGESWEERRVIVRNPRGPAHNPAPIVDEESGAIHFLYCLDYATAYYTRTDDGGLTFAEPADITYAFERFGAEYDWKVIATGIGHGIRLKNGRLIVPVWLSLGTGAGGHHPSVVSVIYSDDDGRTWDRGEILEGSVKDPSETQAVQLADGSVLLNIRNESPEHRRAISVSNDGVRGWSRPRLDPGLYEPVCCGSIVRLTDATGSGAGSCSPTPIPPTKTQRTTSGTGGT